MEIYMHLYEQPSFDIYYLQTCNLTPAEAFLHLDKPLLKTTTGSNYTVLKKHPLEMHVTF